MMHREMSDIRKILARQYKICPAESGEENAFSLEISHIKYGVQKLEFLYDGKEDRLRVRIRGLVHVDASERLSLLAELNRLNSSYRYLRFSCDPEGRVNLDYHFPRNATNLAKSAVELVENLIDRILSREYLTLKEHADRIGMAQEEMDQVLAHVCKELKNNRCSCEYVDGSVVTKCQVHGMTFNIWFTHQEDEGLSACLPVLMHVPESQRKQAQDLMWLLNRRVKDVRFEFDEKNNINLCYDFPEEDDDPSDEAFYVVRLITDAARITIPLLEKELTPDPQEEKRQFHPDFGVFSRCDLPFGEDDLPFDDGEPPLPETASVRHEGALEAIKDELDRHGYDSFIVDQEEVDMRELLVTVRIQDELEMISFIEREGRMAKALLFNRAHLNSQKTRITIEALLFYLDSKTQGLCFVCDDDGDVNISYDYPEDDSNAVDGVCDLVERFIDAANMAQPYLREFIEEDEEEE